MINETGMYAKELKEPSKIDKTFGNHYENFLNSNAKSKTRKKRHSTISESAAAIKATLGL